MNKLYIKIMGIVSFLSLTIVVIILTVFFDGGRLNHFESLKVERIAENYMIFYDVIDESKTKENDEYIIYTLLYNYYFYDKKEMTSDEIIKFLDNKFEHSIDIKISDITSDMKKYNIKYNKKEDKYSIEFINADNDLSKEKLVKYIVTDIKKKKTTYEVSLDKYIISNPYELTNYYGDKKDINDYIEGKTDRMVLYSYLDNDFSKKSGKKEKSIDVIFDIHGTYVKLRN